MNILVFSCSLHPDSKSRVLAQGAAQRLEQAGGTVKLIDLQEMKLPQCDGHAAYADPLVPELREQIEHAAAIVVASPIYNFDVNAACKNLLELTGSSWRDKVVAFLCAAGGRSSYMAPMAFANSLMLDFRCIIVPQFVYASEDEVRGGRIVNHDVGRRLDELCAQVIRFAGALGETTA